MFSRIPPLKLVPVAPSPPPPVILVPGSDVEDISDSSDEEEVQIIKIVKKEKRLPAVFASSFFNSKFPVPLPRIPRPAPPQPIVVPPQHKETEDFPRDMLREVEKVMDIIDRNYEAIKKHKKHPHRVLVTEEIPNGQMIFGSEQGGKKPRRSLKLRRWKPRCMRYN